VAGLRSIVRPFTEREAGTDRSARWWREAESAMAAGRVARARRFLRWILAAQADDEEAWLRLADLASSRDAQVAYLRQAYAFHPHSKRVQAALRQARARQLEATARELRGQAIPLCRLPGNTVDGRSPDREAIAKIRRPRKGPRPARHRTGANPGLGIKIAAAVACSLLITVLLPILAVPYSGPDRQAYDQPPVEGNHTAPLAQVSPQLSPGEPSTQTVPAGPLVARVNGQGIELRALKRQMAQFLTAPARSAYGQEERIHARLPALRRQALDRLIDDVLVQQAAVELGLTGAGEALSLPARAGPGIASSSVEAFEGERQVYEKSSSQDQLRQAVIDQVTAFIGDTAEMVQARRIVLASKQDAWEALGRLADGEGFSQVAKETSLDRATRDKGGDLGWLPRRLGWLAPEVEDMAFSDQPQQIRGPIHVSDRYVIVQVLDHQFDRVLDAGTHRALQELDFERWLAARKEAADIEILIDLSSPLP
jgi:hypothetical protein